MPIPINRTTLNKLFDADLETDEEAAEYLASRAEPVEEIRTSEDVVINAVGEELYELFFRGYTRKQWGLDPSELDKQVTSRIPTRTNTDDRYFSDTFQAMPLDGYTEMFERMLDHPLIDRPLGVDFRDMKDRAYEIADHIIYTGPIDEYFDFRFGKLPYRSLKFDHSDARAGAVPAGRGGQLSDRGRAATRASASTSTSPARSTAQTSITYEYPSRGGRSLLSDPAAGESGAVQALRGAADATDGRDLRRPAGDLPLLQYGPDRRARRSPRSAASMRPSRQTGEGCTAVAVAAE